MNIQPTSFTKNHLINNNGLNTHLSPADELSWKKRREDITRRPSYKKIFNDITGLSEPVDATHAPPPPLIPLGVPQAIGQMAACQLSPPIAMNRQSPSIAGSNSNQGPANGSPSPQALDLLNSAAVAATTQSIQDPTLTGTSQSPVSVVDLQTTTTSAASTPTPTNVSGTQLGQQQHLSHLHHSQHHPQQHHHQQQQQQQHQQHHHHHHLPASNHLQHQSHPHSHQHQLQHHQQQHQHQHPHPHQQQHQHQHPHLTQQQQQQQSQHHVTAHSPQTTTIHQLQMSSSTASSPMGGPMVMEEATKKREIRLQKNREAAKECRRKKKEYIKCLENRVAVLENQNKALIDELKTLKDLYCKSASEEEVQLKQQDQMKSEVQMSSIRKWT